MDKIKKEWDVVIVGGLGHVGLPLGLAFANKGKKVCLYDIDLEKAKTLNDGNMPFIEDGAQEILSKVIHKRLFVSNEKDVIRKCDFLIITVGTPIDEYMMPRVDSILNLFKSFKGFIQKEQTVIIRSTVYPSTCHHIYNKFHIIFGEKGSWDLTYCPERIEQGKSIQELTKLPQVISGFTEKGIEAVSSLFSLISPKIINTSVEEAELIKVFCNAWRYITFAVTNQFLMIAESHGIHYGQLRKKMIEQYDRAKDLPVPGFSGGPCLLKDTLQLASFDSDHFLLGKAAMEVNEGLPNFVVSLAASRCELPSASVGILGMAFKKDVDDIRDSLSYRLRKSLSLKSKEVFCSDEYFQDETFLNKEAIIERCNLIFIATPHSAYRSLCFKPGTLICDIWNITKDELFYIA